MENLPPEILTKIVNEFDQKSRFKLRLVSKQFKNIVNFSIKEFNVGNVSGNELSFIKDFPLNILNLFRRDNIRRDNITDTDLKYLKGMPLQNLNLGWCVKITDEGLKCLEGMPLQSLNLGGCVKITDEGLRKFKGFNFLENLVLWRCHITDVGLKYLENLPIRRLNFCGCKKITGIGLMKLVVKLPNLKKIDLYNCEKAITGELIRLLKELNISGYYDVSDDLQGYQIYYPNKMVKGIDLGGLCDQIINNDSWYANNGLRWLKGVEKINLSNCYQIIDNDRRCNQIIDNGLQVLKGVKN